MANSGAYTGAKATEELFVRNFAEYEHIAGPSGSAAGGDTAESVSDT
jgi:hypothetical protein